MFSHIVVGANDLGKAKTFYDATLGALGAGPGKPMGEMRVAYQQPGAPLLLVTTPINGQAATFANGGTIGFSAASPEAVQAWHTAGCAHGGTSCEDPPGVRDMGFAKLYLAYLRDPDGNKLCAMYPVPA
jgi:catechol 2,3-dioxygenase-like lactoylglutathione lyase family enzyme